MYNVSNIFLAPISFSLLLIKRLLVLPDGTFIKTTSLAKSARAMRGRVSALALSVVDGSRRLEENCMIGSFDVTALHTNENNNEALHAISEVMDEHETEL
ncbi:unnamed protein product [Haemonchus placei]|uniref:Secreted protein n=1 Tax=Haemonchus placei TaxID=6290 RepID=A0A0N4VXE7_HAEPC|nr:unnamed protein product [Haemonchus placei]